uniref:RING finger protein 37 n=1 Tax=Phallusia mammillata TaxID=59560 RepID=A0A6F9DVI6_9ASCI|nr:RING finger protein 37 [Phallusia mammillata]
MMKNPVLLPSGHTIDQRTLDKHIQAQAEWGRPPSDPFTGITFTENQKPVPNVQLKLRLDQHALDTLSSGKMPSNGGVILTNSSKPSTQIKRPSDCERHSNAKIRKLDSGESSRSTHKSVYGSLETTLLAAHQRNAQFRAIQLDNNNEKPNNIYCAKCNAFLSSTVAQYILPCEHKLCRTCCLKISTDSKPGTKHCPNCQASFVSNDVYRTFL